jgi:hypothetical protein
MIEGRRLPPLVDAAPRELNIMIAQGSAAFGVAVMHGGEAIAFLTPAEAEEKARELIEYAKVCRRPGSCPRIKRR